MILLIACALAALLGLAWIVVRIRMRAMQRESLEEDRAQWREIARARGFVVDVIPDGTMAGKSVVMGGSVAGRQFQITQGNFLGYGRDTEVAMRFRVEDVEAKFSVSGGDFGLGMGPQQPPVGDAEFDGRRQLRANEGGHRQLARLGPSERRLLVEFPELFVLQSHGEALIRLPYRLDGAHLDAACRLVERLWGPPGQERSEAARHFLRHTVATLAYRAEKVLRDFPTEHAELRASPTTRTAIEIVSHLGDLMEWAESLARGENKWQPAAPADWETSVSRFFRGLESLDQAIAGAQADALKTEIVFQGPIADSLTHVGQLALMRGAIRAPVKPESYARAEIRVGRVGREQSAIRKEFEGDASKSRPRRAGETSS